MTAQILDRTLTAYRIGDPQGEYPIFDARGSVRYPGRWNTRQSPVIYTSICYATAMLEKLVHGSGRMPPGQHFIEITIPSGLSYEMVDEAGLPGWDALTPKVSTDYGHDWQRQQRSVILIVPSVVARIEKNILINPEHPEFGRIQHSLHRPVRWDARLFA